MDKNKVKKAKVIKEKKKFPWAKIGYYLKTLISNDRVVEVGSTVKWYWTALLFLVSIGLAMIPLTVHTFETRGSSYITNSSYSDSYYLGLQAYVNDETAPDIVFNLPEEGENTATIDGAIESDRVFVYRRNVSDGTDATSRLTFTIYFTDDNNFDSIRENIVANDVDGNTRNSSFILFGSSRFYSQAYSSGTNKQPYTMSGDYAHFKNLTKNNETSISFKNYLSQPYEGFEALSQDAIFNNYSIIADTIYINNRNMMTGIYSGISLGVNGGLILLMGVILFLMTRSKNNPYKQTKWYKFIGMSIWAGFTPAILTLALGFALAGGYELMIFIFAFGFRGMWLSMRQLRPSV